MLRGRSQNTLANAFHNNTFCPKLNKYSPAMRNSPPVFYFSFILAFLFAISALSFLFPRDLPYLYLLQKAVALQPTIHNTKPVKSSLPLTVHPEASKERDGKGEERREEGIFSFKEIHH